MAKPLLAFDCETTIDAAQDLNFGVARAGFDGGAGFQTVAEIIFYADDLPQRNPEGFRELGRYVASHRADVSPGRVTSRRLLLISRTEFVDKWFWPIAYRKEGRVLGFNLPFDLTRIATHCSEARGFYQGGFSLQLWDTTHKPRVCYKSLGNKRAFIGFGTINTPEGRRGWKGDFVDLRTFANALTGHSYTLASACEAFDVENKKAVAEEHGVITTDYIDYARRDVKATTELYDKLLVRYADHPINVEPSRLYSPASLVKAYFKAFKLTPPLQRSRISNVVLGGAMQAFYGGRAECKIRKLAVPVELVDFTSMYPTVNALMGGWQLLTSETIHSKLCTDAFVAWLETVKRDDLYSADSWKGLIGVALIKPQGDVLPVRGQYGPDSSWNIGINLAHGEEAQWWSLADVVASRAITGKTPQVLMAYEFVGQGFLPMRKLRAFGRDLDPHDDLFITAINERREHKDTHYGDFLKLFANSGSYGIFAEMNGDKGRFDGYSGDHEFTVRTGGEQPGVFAFPPLAVAITGAARLMLAMLETEVTARGGTWVFTDTDSMAIAAEEQRWTYRYNDHHGEPRQFRVLSYDDVADIRQKFARLNPYNGGELLKSEYRGHCYSISSKRYCLFNYDDTTRRLHIDKASSHGLGHLLKPADGWIETMWETILDGGDVTADWMTRPAITAHTVTTADLWKVFKLSEQYSIKPHNFMLIAHPEKYTNHAKVPAIYAPYERDSSKWDKVLWTDKKTLQQYTIDTWEAATKDVPYIKVQTYLDVLRGHPAKPEYPFVDHMDETCHSDTIGELFRSHVTAAEVHFIGKESNALDEALIGIAEPQRICPTYSKKGDTLF